MLVPMSYVDGYVKDTVIKQIGPSDFLSYITSYKKDHYSRASDMLCDYVGAYKNYKLSAMSALCFSSQNMAETELIVP